MASGRGGIDHQRPALLPLARSRPGRPYARCAGAASARPASGQTFFPQAAQGTTVRATGAGDGQTEELQRREGADHAGCRASAAQGAQQPGRGLAPADPATGKADETIQIAGPGPTLFIGAWSHQQYLLLSAPPLVGSTIPVRPDCGFFTLE